MQFLPMPLKSCLLQQLLFALGLPASRTFVADVYGTAISIWHNLLGDLSAPRSSPPGRPQVATAHLIKIVQKAFPAS
jgi:hypothetical protein